MQPRKVFVLLPDGVGLKNFAYTDFYKNGKQKGLDIVFWNNTQFDLKKLGFDEIRIENAKPHRWTDVLKKARVQIDLNRNVNRFDDKVYDSYRFPTNNKTIIQFFKNLAVSWITLFNSSEKGILKIRKDIFRFEKKTKYYQHCLEVLQHEKPDFVFCTNQRTVTAIAPILAAQELGIQTGTFIFSWDNLPKATLVIEPDYYFVWSDHMKMELQQYYPFINDSQIIVSGTPQFETHTNKNFISTKEDFFLKYGLDSNKKYICYSGDDITTSPNDPRYLEDTAKAVRELNAVGYSLGIIFRRCPVDFSDRFDEVLKNNSDTIVAIDPKWTNTGTVWNTVLPTFEDLKLQMDTIAHTEMVVNLGSTMAFDYVSFQKPCAFINYDVSDSIAPNWSVKKIYDYVHFRSMPSKEAVLWINSPESIARIIVEGLENPSNTVKNAGIWFEKINQQPAKHASIRILNAIERNISENSIKSGPDPEFKNSKSELKYILAQDFLRYDIRKPLTLRTFLKYFYIDVVPGLKFTIIFRYCQFYRRRNRFLFVVFALWLRRLKYKYGFDISYRAKIGKGLYIGHFGGIVIHGDTEIGEFCNLSQGITIGILVRGSNPGIPKIGDRVFIGPGSAILGGITIGNDVLIGTNAIVTFDVPDSSVVAAPIATIVSNKGSKEYIVNLK